MSESKQITITLTDSGHVQDIRRMTGLDDEDWIAAACAVYWLLLSESTDNVVRFIREDGQIVNTGLTPSAHQVLVERHADEESIRGHGTRDKSGSGL